MIKPKIYIIDNSTSVNGAYKSIHTVLAKLRNRFDFTFIHGTHSPYNSRHELKRLCIPFFEIKRGLGLMMYFPMLFINSIRIARLLSDSKSQIIHVNDLYNMCGVLVKVLRPDIRLIYHIRLLPNSYVGSLYKMWQFLILRLADEIICVSDVVASHWPKRNNIHVIYDAVDTCDRLPPRNMEPSGTINILYLANYIKGKGHDTALKVIASVYKSSKNIRLKMVGGDMGLKKNLAYKNELMHLAQNLGIQDVVSFEDFSDDVELLMKNADVFLNFSESESFSMTCLEALHYGTPCIATDSGGPAEIIVNNKSGFIVPVNNIEAMVSAILELISDGRLRNTFSLAGRERVRELFTAEIQAKYLEQIYQPKVDG